MTRNYFWHPAYDDYPVVGVNWKMAKAFSHWRTAYWNKWDQSKDAMQIEKFRLPTEYEWEFAARGGKSNAMYPWGLVYTRNAKGCLLANFKPGRGNYPEDGGYYAVKATAYFPNDYGLYNMAGNVNEWVYDLYRPGSYQDFNDLNPIRRNDFQDDETLYDKENYNSVIDNNLRVYKGGSWNDIAFWLAPGTRRYIDQDSSTATIGFRCAMIAVGNQGTK